MAKRGGSLGPIGQVASLAVALLDKRTPWIAKLFAAIAVIIPLSPIGLMLDLAPVVGWIDEAAVVALCLWLARRFTPTVARDAARSRFLKR